jgi:hypothetical protein
MSSWLFNCFEKVQRGRTIIVRQVRTEDAPMACTLLLNDGIIKVRFVDEEAMEARTRIHAA